MNERQHIWILGAGRFGKKAVETLCREKPDHQITVVDHDPRQFNLPGTDCICEDALDWLVANLKARTPVAELIVPAIPIHVTAQWLQRMLKEKGVPVSPADLPEPYLRSLPNPVKTGPSSAYTSFAETLCPDSCDEPEGYCFLTGDKREVPLFELLKSAEKPGFTSLVIRSHQLYPGVGAIHAEHLRALLESSLKIKDGLVVVGTACRCHGIIDCLQIG